MKYAMNELPKAREKIRNFPLLAIENEEKLEEESDSFEGNGMKIITTSNIIDIYSRLEIFLGLKLSGHTKNLTKASNLIDELYKRVETQTEQKYRIALDRFCTR